MRQVRKNTTSNDRRKLTQAELKKQQMSHPDLIALMQPNDISLPPFLGHSKSIVIVCAAANTSPTNLSRTLTELGVKPRPFQDSVFKGVVAAGYTITESDIPDAPDTALIDVVTVIQNSRQ